MLLLLLRRRMSWRLLHRTLLHLRMGLSLLLMHLLLWLHLLLRRTLGLLHWRSVKRLWSWIASASSGLAHGVEVLKTGHLIGSRLTTRLLLRLLLHSRFWGLNYTGRRSHGSRSGNSGSRRSGSSHRDIYLVIGLTRRRIVSAHEQGFHVLSAHGE